MGSLSLSSKGLIIVPIIFWFPPNGFCHRVSYLWSNAGTTTQRRPAESAVREVIRDSDVTMVLAFMVGNGVTDGNSVLMQVMRWIANGASALVFRFPATLETPLTAEPATIMP